jgi:peptidase E
MTKYVLQSGNVKKYPEKLKKYNEEVFHDFLSGGKNEKSKNEPVKVLFNFFSQKRENWEIKYESYSNRLKEDVNLKLETKMAMPDEFAEQCQWADVIFFAGGDDEMLLCRLAELGIPKIWAGKVVTGSSAGADFLVNSFYTSDWRMVKKGLGILPVKFIPHYKSDFGKNDPRGPVDWQKAYEE